jgi:pilus assembly protein Flp/PilA
LEGGDSVLQLQFFISKLVQNLRSNEEGQGVVEYALILGLVVVGAIGALTLIGSDVTSVLNNVSNALGNI